MNAMNNRWSGACLAFLLGCLLFVATLRCEAQGNLVPNPGFELLDTCPYTIGFQEGDRPLYWRSWLSSGDYFHACAGVLNSLDTLVDVPLNGWSFQYPWDGDAYIGMYAYDGGSDEYREYVGVELIEPLQVGCAYNLRFRLNPAYGGNYWLINGGGACDNMGMLFTTYSNEWTDNSEPPFPYRNFAHLRSNEPVIDTLAWTLVEGEFIADSAYQYVVLGNFYPDSLTEGFAIGNSWTDIAYYLIDGVEVMPITTGCHGVGMIDPVVEEPVVKSMQGNITVQWAYGPFTIRIVDAIGRVLAEKQSGEAATMEMAWPKTSGLYSVQVQLEERSFVQKFVLP